MTDGEAELDRADMARLVEGQDAALDGLMARHAGRLHGYLRRLLQSESDAEDLAQETFLRVYEHRARFNPRHGFSTWLYTIATNLVRDRYRWRSRHPEAPLDGAGPDGDPSGPIAILSDPRADPRGDALGSERSKAVRRAVAALPDDLRAPLILAEFEELSHQEIALILGCSTKAIEMRIYRARQRLREQLADWLAK